MDKMKFLVTGCAGFIGGHMLDFLVGKGYETVGVDNFSTGKPENMANCRGLFTFVDGDISDPAVSARAVEGVSHIIHLASVPSVPRSVANPIESMQSSVASTVVLFAAAAKAGVRRVVQAASSAAYGDSEKLPKTEDMPPAPLSPYAASKLAQEYYGMAFSASMGLDCVSLRYFNVFGPRQDPKSEYSAVIPKFITLMLEGKRPTIFGDGAQSRDFIYVGDVAAANLAAALHPGPLRGQVINVARGERIDLNQLVAKINDALGTGLAPIHAAPRTGDVLHSVADISKAKKNVGFVPEVAFDEGLRRTIEHYRKV
ncbi:MAG: NAD-dependent epimerase/dehydratase family protein [Planctomycetota bacterium]|jgi:UDP-glucose 4-epimerase|nr:NAD-dependent epimerase/dehydratase family protein [Planctomycetota bacterium]